VPRLILIDTDVMIDYLRGNEKAVSFLRKHTDHIALSSITAAELYAGVRNRAEEETLDALLALFRIIPVTAQIAKIGGLLKRTFGRSHGVGLADAMIAATAQLEDAELATLNTKHYPMLAGLKAAYSKK
jgi:predicted nucleic acid-binding protein